MISTTQAQCSRDIYWGAVPWVVMQLVLVTIIIFWPGLVTSWVDRAAPARAPEVMETPAPERIEQEDQSADIERELKQPR